ncbi:MAG: hypothetical protein QOE30_4998 [Mycobacterium sp.]|jgi:hypothetical protein|uniref:hypothetical protein n=1 Tax=Mycobacterium sp. TaxID=1785 RepID=UPI0028B7CA18|nr:hypothetical protein [Mycobacterium sp.]MDT5119259.1 hypothetical protein [Mycobacterium sp.]
MTPDKAIRLSRQWFTAGIAVLVVRLSLEVVGIDQFTLPLEGLGTLCLLASVHRAGWARGYRARSEETS